MFMALGFIRVQEFGVLGSQIPKAPCTLIVYT